jgi:hypothetical protein
VDCGLKKTVMMPRKGTHCDCRTKTHPQSAIRNPQFGILNPQLKIRNPHSAIRNQNPFTGLNSLTRRSFCRAS